jgi:hypothetical protein
MIKNTAGQSIGAQMIAATDGSAFTDAVTVYVCGDAGIQAAGSVGSGACTHEGNGYHTYAPAQAETNYSLIAFTFTGTGAIPVTVQVETAGGDVYAALAAGVTLADDAITASKFDESTAFPLAAADTGATAVARTGADSDTLESLSDQLDARALETTAQSILTDTGTTLDTLIKDIPTVAEFEARTLPAADYVVVGDTIARVTLVDTVTTLTNAPTVPSAGDIADAVWDEAIAGHAGVGSAGAALSAAGGSGDPWSTALPGAYGAGTAGKALSDVLTDTGTTLDALIKDIPTVAEFEARTLPAADYVVVGDTLAAVTAVGSVTGSVGSVVGDTKQTADVATLITTVGAAGAGLTALATAANLATLQGYVDTEVAAILADTNELQTDWANGGRLDTLLDAAGAAGDPWIAPLPGGYAEGSAGYMLGDLHDRMEEQVPSGPVVITPSPDASQTTAWCMCYDESGAPEEGVALQIKCVGSTMATGAYDTTVRTLTSNVDGLASGLIPRGASLLFEARRGTRGRYVRFSGVDADTLQLPTLLGTP